MKERIEPIDYIENMWEAWHNESMVDVEELRERHGKQPVTLDELEQVFTHAISLLMTAYQDKDVVDNAKFEVIIKLLESERIIDSNEAYLIHREIEDLENKLKGEDE